MLFLNSFLLEICGRFGNIIMIYLTKNIKNKKSDNSNSANANLYKNANWENNYPWCWSIRYYGNYKIENSKQRRYSSWSNEAYLCWKITWGWKNFIRLQHLNRFNTQFSPKVERRRGCTQKLILCGLR